MRQVLTALLLGGALIVSQTVIGAGKAQAQANQPFNSYPGNSNNNNNSNDDSGAGAALAGILLLGLGAAAVAAASADKKHHHHHNNNNNPWGPGPAQPSGGFSPQTGVYCYSSERECFVNGQYNYYWSNRIFP